MDFGYPAPEPLTLMRQRAVSKVCLGNCGFDCCDLPPMPALVYQKTIVGEQTRKRYRAEFEPEHGYPAPEPLLPVRQRALRKCIGDCGFNCGNGCSDRPP
jgi:hypothetical protein